MKKESKKSKAVDAKELILAIDELEKERGITKDVLIESIENALITAYRRDYESAEYNAKVVMDRETGETHLYIEKDVVENVEDSNTQINLQDAHKISKKLEIGDKAQIEIIPKDFGRIAAQTAKQVIIQKIREVSREVLYEDFSEKKGEIVNGIIQKADGGVVVLDLGKIEGLIMVKEQVPTESYKVNDKIRAYIIDVIKGAKGVPQVMLSRSDANFVKKLFELEIPEIYEGLIEVKSIARDPGKRTKIAVYSQNENIDPVGSCVGQKGIRIQNIIKELNGEKIDVIEWNEDPSTYISSALLPAKVLAVDIKEDDKFAQVIVPDDQLSIAIGKSGQNARLSAKLTNWKIDIKSESQFREMLEDNKSQENINDNTEETIVNQEEMKQQQEEILEKEVEVNKEEINE